MLLAKRNLLNVFKGACICCFTEVYCFKKVYHTSFTSSNQSFQLSLQSIYINQQSIIYSASHYLFQPINQLFIWANHSFTSSQLIKNLHIYGRTVTMYQNLLYHLLKKSKQLNFVQHRLSNHANDAKIMLSEMNTQ